MVSYPNESKDLIGYVVGGGDDDPDTKKSGACRVYIPSLHSDDVNREHLPWITRLGSGGNEGTTDFGGPPEDGTCVIVRQMAGQKGGFGYIVGVVKDETAQGLEAAGNFSLLRHKAVKEAKQRKHKINSKAKAGSGEAGSKPTEEAGEKYFRDLVKGIPSSSTLWPIAGMKIPQVNSIETATQAFTSIIPPSALSGLPGLGLSLGNLFSNMPSILKDQLKSKLPGDLVETLDTITNLIPESSPSGLEGIRVNPEVFYPKVVELLSTCRDLDDLVECILSLLTDTSLHGTDTLPNITIQVDTPFGKANVEFDVKGTGNQKADETISKLLGAFSSLLTNSSGGFPGALINKNMWGQSSQVMGEMMNRLKPEEYKKAIEMAQKSIAPGTNPRQLLNVAQKVANEARDILDL